MATSGKWLSAEGSQSRTKMLKENLPTISPKKTELKNTTAYSTEQLTMEERYYTFIFDTNEYLRGTSGNNAVF